MQKLSIIKTKQCALYPRNDVQSARTYTKGQQGRKSKVLNVIKAKQEILR